MHCHRILVSALFVDMSFLLTSFISKKYFYFHLFPLVFVHSVADPGGFPGLKEAPFSPTIICQLK